MCDFIFMIYRGKKVLDGTLESIKNTYGSDVLHVRLESDNGHVPLLERLPGVLKVTDFGMWQELRIARDFDHQQILQELMRRGRVAHFELASPSLQDIFVRIASPDDATVLKGEEVLA
jgi:ABC-2 type transport system ATP-binding protein